jgi:tetratricopeptide (TPR) repeat protein
MRSTRLFGLALAALLVLCFGLAAHLDLWFQSWAGNRTQSPGLMGVLFGDSRRMFANHFFVKADAYFHSGYYPTIFDNQESVRTPHIAEDSGAMKGENTGDELGFLGPPRDWIDAFSRRFTPAVHTHLDEGGAQGHSAAGEDLGGGSQVREILPWLKLSATLDPSRVETYTVAAYWLRERMGKTDEAEQFLREGLRANPNSAEILYELGRVYSENKNDPDRARNLWEAALRQWQKQEAGKSDPDKFLFVNIVTRLALLEEKAGHREQAIAYMELWKAHSPNPEAVQKQIDELIQSPPAKSPESASGQP